MREDRDPRRAVDENLAAMLEGEGAAAEPAREQPEAAAAGGDGAAATEAPPTATAEADDALDLGSLGGAMAAERLKDPLVIALLIVAFLLGRRTAR